MLLKSNFNNAISLFTKKTGDLQAAAADLDTPKAAAFVAYFTLTAEAYFFRFLIRPMNVSTMPPSPTHRLVSTIGFPGS